MKALLSNSGTFLLNISLVVILKYKILFLSTVTAVFISLPTELSRKPITGPEGTSLLDTSSLVTSPLGASSLGTSSWLLRPQLLPPQLLPP